MPVDAARSAMPRLLLLTAGAVSLVSGGLLVAALVYLRQEAIKVSEELTDTAAQWVEAQTSRTIELVDQRLQLALAGLPEIAARSHRQEKRPSQLGTAFLLNREELVLIVADE